MRWWPQTGIRIVGPSSLGVVNLREGVMLTANAAFAEPDIPVGRTFVASHSGTMIGALMSRGKARGVGFAGLVSIGNEVDLSVGEICLSTLDDPDIDGYLLFLESIRNASALREFALGAAARGKPVVAYKLGRSSAARELAVTHTGALAGEDDVASAFLADCGIARVESLEALLEALPLVRRTPIRTRRRTHAARRGAHHDGRRRHHGGRPARDARRRDHAAERRHDGAPRRQGHRGDARAHRRPHHRGRALRRLQGRARRAHHRARVRHRAGGRRLLGTLPPGAWQSSRSSTAPIAAEADRGVPGARGARRAGAIEQGRRAGFPHAGSLRRRHRGRALRGANRKPAIATPTGNSGRVLDELEAYALLDRLGLPRSPAVALDTTITQAPALPFAYPVAVKVLSADIPHKTEAGGVALNVRDGDALRGRHHGDARDRASSAPASRRTACWSRR